MPLDPIDQQAEELIGKNAWVSFPSKEENTQDV